MIAGYTFYQLVWYFVIYSFLGWCVEVVYCTVKNGYVINRGFLNGPVCPIYGFGMLAVLILLKGLSAQAAAGAGLGNLALFFGGMLLTSTVELVGGFLMLKLFHARWWDYTDKPFNIGGYVCLEFSILWGLGTVFVVRLLQPAVAHATAHSIPTRYGWPILAVLYTVYFVDLVVTLVTVAGLNRDLKQLDQVSAALHKVSDALSENLGTSAMQADQKLDEGRLQMALAKAEARDAVTDAAATAAEKAARAAATAAAAARSGATVLAGAGSTVRDAMAEAKENALCAADAARLAATQKKAAQNRAALAARKTALEAQAAALRGDVLNKRHIGGGRLLKAFPSLSHTQYKSILDDLKTRMLHKD